MKKFSSKKEVDQYLGGNFLICLLCNKPYKALGTHLLKKHGLHTDDYRIMFGLPFSRGLVAEETSRKMASALQDRIMSGDKSLQEFTPELAWKAQHSPRRNVVYYRLIEKRNYGKVQANSKIEKSRQRINSIDWGNYLHIVKETGLGCNSLKNYPGMPSVYDVQKKKNMDPEFASKYIDILKTLPYKKGIKNKNKIIELYKSGMNQREIAAKLSIGKTTVSRILKIERLKT